MLNVGGSTGAILGALTINSGAAVELNAANALGYNTGVCVTAVNVNGATIDNAASDDNGFITNFSLTGGTMSATGGRPYAFNPGYGITTNASTATSLISANLALQNDMMSFSVAAGTIAGGVDLLVSGTVVDRWGTSSPGGIVKTGGGLMALTSSNNSYSGGTNLDAGVLRFVNGGVGGGAVAFSGGTLQWAGGTPGPLRPVSALPTAIRSPASTPTATTSRSTTPSAAAAA